MDVKTAIKAGIEKWENMIKWAGKQPAEEKKSAQKMKDEIGYDWYGDSCALCQLFSKVINQPEYHGEDFCRGCPMDEKFGDCSSLKNNNHWTAVTFSETWEEWIDNARIFLNQLRGLEVTE